MTRLTRGFLFVLVLLQVLSLTTVAAAPSPSLPPLPVFTGDPMLDHAERLALQVLAANQYGESHRAAPFYSQPWIRDSYAWGMVPDNAETLATYATTELQYWLQRQQGFGGWISFQYSGWYDETAILIAAVLDAYRQTGDLVMVRRALPQLSKAWSWLYGSYVKNVHHGSRCLLWVELQPAGKHWATDWADQVSRQGYTPQLEGLWYQATHAMAALERIAGNKASALSYDHFDSCIATDANRLLWTTAPPAHRNVPPLPSFGHYRALPAGGNYFEIDANALLVAAGMAAPAQSSAVLSTIADQTGYLLGGDGAGPARVVYGDYAPADYGLIHNWIGDGRYQSAYWPSVGGLLAVAAARNGDTTLSLSVLRGLAHRSSDSGSAFHEWYSDNGVPSGASSYSWGARMYLVALYRAYLGVDDSTSTSSPADLVLLAAPGPARGDLVRLGKHLTVVGHGAGRFRYARIGNHILRSNVIPASLLTDGAVIDVYRS